MDRIIFGDNQFFGINHMSEEKAMAQARRFHKNSAIINVIDTAYDCGIHAFTFSTHDRVRDLCDHFRAHPDRYADLRLYPAMPYAQKYAHAVANKGILGAIKEAVLDHNTTRRAAGMIARGSSVLFTQNAVEIMRLLVDAEMTMFRDLNVRVIFLQNVVTDLLLGAGWYGMLAAFAEYVEERYQTRAGFITLNMPRLVDVLLDEGIDNPVVCSAINKVGFQMHPDKSAYEEALTTKLFTAAAMSILAAGAIKPTEAIEYVAGFDKIQSIVFGASTRSHIEQTKQLIESARLAPSDESKDRHRNEKQVEYAS